METPSKVNYESVVKIQGKRSILASLPLNRTSIRSTLNQDAEKILKEIRVMDQPFNKIDFITKAKVFMGLILPSLLLAVAHSGNIFINTFGFYIAGTSGSAVISSAYGLTIFLDTVWVYSFTQPIIEKIGISCAVCYGAKDFNGVRENFIRGFVLFTLYTIFLFTPFILCVDQILEFIGISSDVAEKTGYYQLLLFPIDITRLIGELMVSFLISQGVEASFGYFTFLSLMMGMVVSWWFGIEKDMGVEGFIIGRAVFDGLNVFFIILVYLYKVKGPGIKLANIRNSFKGMWKWFLDVLQFTIVLYSEFFGFEISTLMCTLTHDDVQIAAYTSIINICYLVWSFGNGFSNTSRTRVNYLLGQKKGDAAKNFFIITFYGMFLLGLLIGLGLYFSRFWIADVYANENEDINKSLVRLLGTYAFFTLGDLFFSFMFTIARSTNQVCLNMCLDYLILVGAQTGISYYLITKKGGGNTTALIVMESCLIITFVILLGRFFTMDWNLVVFEDPEVIPILEKGGEENTNIEGELLKRLTKE